ncbi:MAG: V-type ATPase subunit [Acidimicrobiia bacterium]|jgi:V/A-type H+/Na+-transporting ATPase subunit C
MTGFEYGNTRLRAMRSRLLRPHDYLDLMRATDLDHLLGALGSTDFRPDVEAAVTRFGGSRRLDEAVRGHLARLVRTASSFYEGAIRRRIDLVTRRWDLHNLRTLLRAQASSPPVADVGPLLVPAGVIGEAELRALAEAPGLKPMIDQMVAWGLPGPATARALLRAWPRYETGGDLTVLEHALDASFAAQLEADIGRTDDEAAELVRTEIDVRNLDVALRARRSLLGGEPLPEGEPAFLPGGTIAGSVWVSVSSELGDDEEVVRRLDAVTLPAGWPASIAAWAGHGRDQRLVRELEDAAILRAMAGFERGDPLGIAVPVAFIAAASAEARNVRLVGRAVIHGTPLDDLEPLLLVP